jgi:branched-chain amino acid transport system substrate-binding protein
MQRPIAAVLAAVMTCWTVPASADVIKIGLIADYTGVFAAWGPQFQQAIEAFQASNGKAVRGPDGKEHEVQFIYRDSSSAGPDKAKQLAEELVLRDRVKILSGFVLSPHAMAVAPLATESKTPVVIMNAATSSITRMSPYFARVSMTIPQYVSPLAEWSYANGIRRVYTIVSDYSAGHDAETYFSKTFKAAGGEIVGSARTPMQEMNFSPYVERILQAKPDALYMFQPAGAPSIAFVKAFVERGLRAAGIKLLAGGETQEQFLPSFSDDIIGTVTSAHYTVGNTNPLNVRLKEQIKTLFGERAAITDVSSVAAWDGTNLIYQAIGALGPDADGSAYVAFMKGKKLDSPRGPIMIDPDERDIVQNIYIRRVERRDGKLANVDIATYEMVKDPWKQEHPAR